MSNRRKPEHFLIDGYNMIFAWGELRSEAAQSLADARDRLIDALVDYQASSGHDVTVVFDAYKVKGGPGNLSASAGVSIVYTKEGETADNLIEELSSALSRGSVVRVVTSDYTEQIVSFSKGAFRMSVQEFVREMALKKQVLRENYIGRQTVKRNLLIDNLDEATAQKLENMRYIKHTKGKGDTRNQ